MLSNLPLKYTAHGAAVNSVTFHPSGNYLLSGASDNTLKVSENYNENYMNTTPVAKAMEI
jgi:WD40 repeat protein